VGLRWTPKRQGEFHLIADERPEATEVEDDSDRSHATASFEAYCVCSVDGSRRGCQLCAGPALLLDVCLTVPLSFSQEALKARFVDSKSRRGCHQKAYDEWKQTRMAKMRLKGAQFLALVGQRNSV